MPALADAFAQDIVYLKQSGVNPIVVHGGGPQIAGDAQEAADLQSDFVQGLRVTDKPTVEVVEMVLAGLINKDIVSAINRQGGKAVGISRQGCQPDDRAQDHRDARPGVEPDAGGRHRLCRRSRRGQPAHRRRDLRAPTSSPSSLRSASAATAKRSTSTPTPSPARSPRA